MKNDDHIDEIFREGLSSLDVPPPPSQDWAAMARAARTNAVLAGKGQGSSSSVQWLKLLGGATAVTGAIYLAFITGANTPAQEGQTSAAALLTEHAEPLSPTNEITTSKYEEPTIEREGNSSPPLVSAAWPVGAHASDAPHKGGTRSGGTAFAGEQAVQVDHSTDRIEHVQAGGPLDPVSTVLTQRPASHLIAGSPNTGTGNGHEVAPPDERITAFVVPEETQRITAHSMQLLAASSRALPYEPMLGTAIDQDDYMDRSHWSVAPWMSTGWSSYVDAETGSGTPSGSEGDGGPNVSYGLRVEYALDHRLAFLTGFGFVNKGPIEGWVHSSTTRNTEYHLSGQYIEIPLAVKGTLPLGRMDLYARSGITLQFNRPGEVNKVVVHDEDMKQMSTLALAGSSMGTAIDIGVGTRFQFSPALSVFIEPAYQFGLSPAVKHRSFDELPFNPRINSFSLITGLSILLR